MHNQSRITKPLIGSHYVGLLQNEAKFYKKKKKYTDVGIVMRGTDKFEFPNIPL